MELALLVLAAAAAILLFRRRQRSAVTVGDAPAAGPKYWGVRVLAPAQGPACAVVRRSAGRGLRLERAPTLPLPGCDLRLCGCRLEYLPERRGGPERRSGRERRQAIRFDLQRSDRRDGHDRRSDNDAWSWTWS